MKEFVCHKVEGVFRILGEIAVDCIGSPAAHGFDCLERYTSCDCCVCRTSAEGVTREIGRVEAGVEQSSSNIVVEPTFAECSDDPSKEWGCTRHGL